VFNLVRDEGGDQARVICNYPHFSELHMGRQASEKFPSSEQGLRELYDKGYRYLVLVDFIIYYLKRLEAPELARLPAAKAALDSVALAKRIHAQLEPIYEIPCNFCLSPMNIMEININFTESKKFMDFAREKGLGKIRIYDLNQYFSD